MEWDKTSGYTCKEKLTEVIVSTEHAKLETVLISRIPLI
jgi:hypothetical protein